MQYKAVNITDLRTILGSQCSTDSHREGYVIGPDVTGRLSHCASCRSMVEAKQLAEKMNCRMCPDCSDGSNIATSGPFAGYPENCNTCGGSGATL